MARRISKPPFRPEYRASAFASDAKNRHSSVVGGFAGVKTAVQLEKQFRADPTVAFTPVSENEFMALHANVS